jgi:hypothetical protein
MAMKGFGRKSAIQRPPRSNRVGNIVTQASKVPIKMGKK